MDSLHVLVALLLLPTFVHGQSNERWAALVDDIAHSSLLSTRPGSTLERDVQALIYFFNNTCTAQAILDDASNPYRGAFAQVSQWRQQTGWRSIVEAHSSVAVQCRALYMEGGNEFVAKHCFWNIQSLSGVNGTVYPSPRWTIVEDCCEQLDRPVLRVLDAVWATTRGVGRAHRKPPMTTANLADADDYAYVPKIDCDQPINSFTSDDCDSAMHNVDREAPSARPIGVRSAHYFNVGIAVGEKGTMVRTMDGGYTWDCVRGCARGVDMPNLNSISVNVRLGGFGYSSTYYNAQGGSNVDGIDWTLLALESGQPQYTGLDGVYWPDQTGVFMEGYAVGEVNPLPSAAAFL